MVAMKMADENVVYLPEPYAVSPQLHLCSLAAVY
jgi:hypothetical protein